MTNNERGLTAGIIVGGRHRNCKAIERAMVAFAMELAKHTRDCRKSDGTDKSFARMLNRAIKDAKARKSRV